MTIILPALASNSLFWWISAIIALIILFVALKYFVHIIGHIIEIAWRGCVVVVLIVVVYYILHALGVI